MSFDDARAALASGNLAVCPNPIFVIGCPRSGTTALARALGEHSRLWTSHESYFLNGLFGDGRAGRVHAHQARRAAPGWLLTENVDRAEFLAYAGAGLNALYTSRSGGRRWVEQTPLYTRMADELAELFPGAVFLHALRDGRDVVASMVNFLSKFEGRPEAAKHIPAWAADFAASCQTWTDYVTHAVGFVDDVGDRSFTVVNDVLSADPEAGMAAVSEFLGVDPEPGPVAYLSGTRVNSSFGRAGAGDKRWRTWSAVQRSTFNDICGPVMVALGFATPDELDAWAAAAPVPPPAGPVSRSAARS
jgi:hypothetical protein